MKKFALTILTACVLVACSQENSSDTAAASAAAQLATQCASPTLNQQVQDSIRQVIATQAQQFAQADSRDFVDADKVIAAAAQLHITVAAPQANDAQVCQAQVMVNIPENIIVLANQNALLLDMTPTSELLQEKFSGSQNVKFDGKSIVFNLNYSNQNQQFSASDATLIDVANVLSNALLAYGVKDTLVVGHKAISRIDALKLLQESDKPEPPKVAFAPAAPEVKDVPPMGASVPKPPADLPNRADNMPVEHTDAPQPKTMTPQDTQARPSISMDELNAARNENASADKALKQAWRGISPDIQQDLLEDQKSWERKKRAACRHVAAKGADAAESQYLQMQCDTRMTREQVQYLKGYSIE